MIYIGIDPGVSGGIAKLVGDCKEIRRVEACKMPAARNALLDVLSDYRASCAVTAVAYVEVPPISMGKLVTASAIAKLNRSYERCAMACIAYGMYLVEVTPQKWQKFYGFKREGRTPTQWKNMLKDKAIKLFPNIKVTLAIADALLIANYARRVHV